MARERRVRGSIYETRGGKWRAQVTVGGRRESLIVHEDREYVEAVLDAYLERTRDVEAGNTLMAYGETWLARRERRGVSGVEKERSRWQTHVEAAPFATIPLRSIKRRHIAQWVWELAETPAVDTITYGRKPSTRTVRRPTGRTLSRSVVRDCLSLVRICLREAADEGRIDQSPVVDVRPPRTMPRDPAWTWLRQEEIDAVLAAPAEEWRRLLFTVAVYTGLRASELWRLRWGRVVLSGERPRIEVRAPAKSQAAIRDVPLLPQAREALARWRELQPATPMPQRLVWPRDDGEAHREYDAGWAALRERRTNAEGEPYLYTRDSVPTVAGIERPVRFHDLRHTAASHLVQGTWTTRALRLDEARQWLGHTSVITTQRYAHLCPGAVAELAHTDRTHAHGQDEWADEK